MPGHLFRTRMNIKQGRVGLSWVIWGGNGEYSPKIMRTKSVSGSSKGLEVGLDDGVEIQKLQKSVTICPPNPKYLASIWEF